MSRRTVREGTGRGGLIAFVLLVLALGSWQCAPAADDDTSSEDPIYGGAVDTDGQSNGAVVALRVGQATTAELCSAAAIAPNVLLTARHCVSQSITHLVVCNSKGESENGPHFGADQPTSEIRVYTGAKPDFTGPVAAEVKQIFHPDGDVVCNRDIALLVLDRDLDNVKPMPVRLTRAVGVEETIRSVGYGKTDTGVTGTRLRKTGVVVRAVGPGLSKSDTALGDHEFEVGLSICHGDSGGPAISQTTGAIVGVVSRGGDCSEDFGHIYVETSGFADLIDQAMQAAGAPPPADEPTAAAGAPAPPSPPKKGCAVAAPGAPSEASWGMLAALGALATVAAARRRRG